MQQQRPNATKINKLFFFLIFLILKNKNNAGTSLVFQWLKLCINAGGPGSIPGQGTRFHVPQLRPSKAK